MNPTRPLGVLMLDTRFPRVPGDIGHAASLPFPVRYRVVRGASPQRVVRERDPALLQPFVEAGRALADEGAAAITTSCGFLVLFQYEPGDIEISFFSNTEAEGNFYGYIFHNNVRNFWQLMRRHTGTNYYGDHELEPGKWYYLLMRADQQSGGSIQLWEQGQQEYLINQFIEGDGIERRWTSFFNVSPRDFTNI